MLYVVVPMSVSLPFGWLRSPQHLNCRPLPPDARSVITITFLLSWATFLRNGQTMTTCRGQTR